MDIGEDALDELLTDILVNYGYDFTDYARASMMRRITRLCILDKFEHLTDLRSRLFTDPHYLLRFVTEITVNVTEMFRDPQLYKVIREQVLPILATHPLIRIWHAGCATGEEVFSLAILLKEAGLLHKSLLYATDINPVVLDRVKSGIYSIHNMREYSENYRLAGGVQDFSKYYTAQYDLVKFDHSLSKNIIVSTHNLVSDSSFNSFQLIFCRNVLIYFNAELQNRALQVFDQSLETLGFLALGSKETLRFSPIHPKYKIVDDKNKVWRKNA